VAVVITDTEGGAVADSVISNDLNNITINNRFKCQFCSNTYKSSTAKPYYNHLKNKHPASDIQTQTQLNSTFIEDFFKFKTEDFCMLHHNIRSLPKSLHEMDIILNTQIFDIVSLNETKLDSSFPAGFYRNPDYVIIRRDKDRQQGGLLMFIKKEYKIVHYDIGETNEFKIDYIYLKIKIKKQIYNFISCYKPPHQNDKIFIDELENLIYSINCNEPLFILGDLNMNIFKKDNFSNINIELSDFINNNILRNYVNKPTRIATIEKNGIKEQTETLIDVIVHNEDLISDCDVIDCPYSDHCFVVANIKIIKASFEVKSVIGRKLTQKNLQKLYEDFDSIDFSDLHSSKTTETKWTIFKDKLLKLINKIMPEENIYIKTKDLFPWVDSDLLYIKHLRDAAYKKYIKNNNANNEFEVYKDFKLLYDKNYIENMIEYFKSQKSNDFKNSKLFWQFYSTYINVKSDRTLSTSINSIKRGDIVADNPCAISNLFNVHFTSLTSDSNASKDECFNFAKENLDFVKNKLKTNSATVFKFHNISYGTVFEQIKELQNSKGPGITGIPTKILKILNEKICVIVTNLFNECIKTSLIPSEWKSAVVTPLYKRSGSKDDANNYRGISVLPPIGKIFEKILANQIKEFLDNNNLLFAGQYGFRNNHSCESALHEILSDMFKVLSDRKIGLYFFIDFKKAFDLVPADLLLFKLKYYYGFDDLSIKLLQDYFTNRTQYVKVDTILSDILSVLLGVPQGSVLGPLLFVLFINDMPFFLKLFLTILFADDTTLGLKDDNYDILINKFLTAIEDLIKWCQFNKFDINWKKSEIMFITNKNGVNLPDFIKIDNHQVKVVTEFKLLGIIIDNKLNFVKNTCKVRKSINTRLYSIQKLFQLDLTVKIQFLKTFILPYFDYCSTLCIYFSKEIIQKLANSYNNCIFKLVDTKKICNFTINSSNDFNLWNNQLSYYNINSFQHRILFRLNTYIYKILHYKNSPRNLSKLFIFNSALNKKYSLRNTNDLYIPSIGRYNDNGEKQFDYFFSKFINEIMSKNEIELDFDLFKTRAKNNINLLFLDFVVIFINFDLNFKKMFKNYKKL
jgi:hypothetical protein